MEKDEPDELFIRTELWQILTFALSYSSRLMNMLPIANYPSIVKGFLPRGEASFSKPQLF
jgi:hypothetical protein